MKKKLLFASGKVEKKNNKSIKNKYTIAKFRFLEPLRKTRIKLRNRDLEILGIK